MKLKKRVLSTALAGVMILGSTVSFAADFDLKNKNTGEVIKFEDYIFDDNKFSDIIFDLGSYYMEANGGKNYDAQALVDGMKGGVSITDAAKKLEAVETELKVESISAITPTTIKVVFSQKIDSIETSNFSIQGTTVENANLGEDGKTVTLKVSGLDYGQKYTLKASDILVNAQKQQVTDQTFTAPSVNDLWEIELTTSAENDKILANGADNTVITAKLIDKVTGEVDTNADDVVLSFAATYGNLANTRVTVQNGVATVVLVSESSSKDLVSKIDAQIIDGSGIYKDLIGKVVGVKNVYFVTSDSTLNPDEKPALLGAGSNSADRVTLYFNRDVSIDDFVATDANGKYKIDVDGNAVLRKATDGTPTEINITQNNGSTVYKIKGFKTVPGNTKALEAVLAIDRANIAADTTPNGVLIDNKQVDVDLVMPSNVGAQTTNASFILTDARKPEATSVNVKDLRTLTVKFSESIAKAGVEVDGGLVNLDSTTPLEFGEFKFNSKTNSWDDNRDIVTVHIGQDSDLEDIYLAPGKHSIQLSSVYDFAGLTDSKNISTSQSLDFNVVADDSIPTATVNVESPEQFRVTFNRKVNGFSDATKVELQRFIKGTGGAEDKWVKVSDAPANSVYTTVPTLSYQAVPDSSDYILELENDWTKIYNTTTTTRNYYNDKYRLVIAEDVVTNPTNGKKNAEIIMPLNYVGSPLNTPDTTNPAIAGFERVEDTNIFDVTMSKPVKLPGKDNAGNTPSQQQGTTVPTPIVEFIGTDKDGNKVTIDGTVLGYGDKDKADKIVQVQPSKNLKNLVNIDGHSANWQLVVRSISDDVGNTAGTLTHNFEIKADSVTNLFQVQTVTGIEGATTADDDIIKVKFTSPVQYVGNVENAVNVSNYLLDAENLPKGSNIKIDQTSGNSTTGYDTINITVPNGTLSRTVGVNNVLTVSKNLKSSTNIILTGDYEIEFATGSAADATEATARAAAVAAINTVISNTESLLETAVEGTDAGQYAVGSIATLQTAITAAKADIDNPAKTSSNLGDPGTLGTLEAAVAVFEAGKVAAAGDNTALKNDITVAKDLVYNAVQGTSVGEYVTPAIADLRAAITVAEGVANNPASTVTQISDARTDLANAIVAFEEAKVTGVAGTLGFINQGAPATAAEATVQDASGDTLKVSDPSGRYNNIVVTISQAGNDVLAVTSPDAAKLNIALANTTAGNNTAAKIQEAIRALGAKDYNADDTVDVDFSDWTATAGGSWDTATTGGTLTTASHTTASGVPEVTENVDFTVSAGATQSGTVKVTVNSVDYKVPVTAGQTVAQVAKAIFDELKTKEAITDLFTITNNGTDGVIKFVSKTANTDVTDLTMTIVNQ